MRCSIGFLIGIAIGLNIGIFLIGTAEESKFLIAKDATIKHGCAEYKDSEFVWKAVQHGQRPILTKD